jgi:Protein of unknown function (DUF707)
MLVYIFLMQNDLVHGWGLDFALRKCVEVYSLNFEYIRKYTFFALKFIFNAIFLQEIN